MSAGEKASSGQRGKEAVSFYYCKINTGNTKDFYYTCHIW
jgi:hypothetical protein